MRGKYSIFLYYNKKMFVRGIEIIIKNTITKPSKDTALNFTDRHIHIIFTIVWQYLFQGEQKPCYHLQ